MVLSLLRVVRIASLFARVAPSRRARRVAVGRTSGVAPLVVLSLLAGFAPVGAWAQAPRRGAEVTVRPGTALRATPGGEVVGVSSRAITGTVESSQGAFVRLTVDGFLPARSLRFTADRSRGEVAPANGASLRATAREGSAVLAELRAGTYVFPPRAGGRFPAGANAVLEVRRALWVDASRLERGRTGATTSAGARASADRAAPRPTDDRGPGASSTAATAAREEARRDSLRRDSLRRDSVRRDSVRRDSIARRQDPASRLLETRGQAALRYGPDGDVVATVPGGVGLTPLARDGGWVRVRIEGWLPDSALQAAGARSAGALSAADLRADPTGTVGRIVRWRVEALAYQVADALRTGLAPDEPYLLARGPGSERAVLYLALPDSLRAAAQALPPLTEITVTARVRNGRSAPAGVPVLELLELSRR